MTDQTSKQSKEALFEQAEEAPFTYEISDEALEAAGGKVYSDWTPSPKCTKTQLAFLCCK